MSLRMEGSSNRVFQYEQMNQSNISYGQQRQSFQTINTSLLANEELKRDIDNPDVSVIQ